MDIQTEVLTITPDMAKELLEKNTNQQRAVSKHSVARYAEEMKNERWIFNGEAIKIDEHGNLIDGQHRLLACIKSDTAFESLVIKNLPSTVFHTLDTGKVRRVNDCFSMIGVASPNDLAAAIRLTMTYSRLNPNQTLMDGTRKGNITNVDAIDFYEADRESWDHTMYEVRAYNYKFAYQMLAPAVFGLLFHMFKQIDEEMHRVFFNTIATGEPALKFDNPSLSCPVAAARNRLIQFKLENGKYGHSRYIHHAKIAFCLHAWNCLLANEGVVNFPRVETKVWPVIANDPYRKSSVKEEIQEELALA